MLCSQRLHAEDQLHAAARAEQMAELALGAGDAHLAGVLAEDGFDGDRFGLVAQRRARAVGVDVVDRVGVELGHRAGRRLIALAAPVPSASGCVMWPPSALAP